MKYCAQMFGRSGFSFSTSNLRWAVRGAQFESRYFTMKATVYRLAGYFRRLQN